MNKIDNSFYYTNNITISPDIEWSFDLGKFTAIINGVIVPDIANISFCKRYSIKQVVGYDKKGNVAAYANIDNNKNWIFGISIDPSFRLYQFNINAGE